MEPKTKEKQRAVLRSIWGLIVLASFVVLFISGGMNKAMHMCGWYSAPYSLRIAVPTLVILSSLIVGGTCIAVLIRAQRSKDK